MGAVRSMRTQFILMMVMASIITMLCVGAIFTKNILSSSENEIENYRTMLMEDVERELRNETMTAVSIIESVYKRQQSGQLTEAQAKEEAAALIRNLRYDDGAGYFWIDTYEGINVALLGRTETEGKSRLDATDPTGKQYVREMIQIGQQPGGGFTDLMFAKPNSATPLPKRNFTMSFAPYRWVIGTGVWIDYIDSKIAEEQKKVDENFRSNMMLTIGVTVVLEILICLLAGPLSAKLIAPIRDVTKTLETLATGDFRKPAQEHIDVDRDDEIGVMGRAAINLRSNVREMLQRVVAAAEQVAAASEQLTASADQSSVAINQVAESITTVAGACNEQFTEVENAGHQSDQLKQNMKTFTDMLTTSENKIKATNEAADLGDKSVAAAVDQMKVIESAVSDTADVIAKLGEESDKIGKIVEAIAAISDQTNLLALNAAIEAARAGEHGRGFAVVADEVRKLAEQSQSSAREISDLIGSIQEKAQAAVTSMQTGVDKVRIGTEAVTGGGQAFKQIADMVTEVANNSRRMGEIVSTLVDSTDEITKSVENINSKSREVAKESETVSAASEEQTATMHEIADASRSLATQAQQMQEVISRFKV
ncbi:MAG: cache domain-containing protein [Selenomonadaceae bacterium]|nr:cache domain-containing protein [Selenomonadaceae bacterium]